MQRVHTQIHLGGYKKFRTGFLAHLHELVFKRLKKNVVDFMPEFMIKSDIEDALD